MPGTNTIAADLKRPEIRNEIIRAFATRVLPLRAFASAFENVPLQGTDEVVVPYFPLRTDASTDFVAANGYVMSGTTNSSSKKITVNKRKYQPLDFSSAELSRQPAIKRAELIAQCAAKLAVDVMNDILSVITAANFGAAVFTDTAANFNSDDVIDIAKVCTDANWPDSGRSLILNSAYDAALKKDSAVKDALAFGGSEVIREGRIPVILGHDYFVYPTLPANAENLVGVVAHRSAILCAMAPVAPAPGVRARLAAYETLTDPATGISFNYRHWGNAALDRDEHVLEVSYGYVTGEAAALKRLTSA